jgi:UDP-GlcNAc:undecaprenyl-phosphate GlcNAc-1-phosphate transferase
MNTLFTLFLLSFLLSLLLTPYAGKLATSFGIVDEPMMRKVHGRAIPRIGGVVILFSFILPFTGAFFVYTDLLVEVLVNPAIIWLGLGGLIVFLLGLWDDIHRLPALVKFIIQVAAAAVAYVGGLRIEGIFLPGDYVFTFQYFSFIVTVFWFVLVVNAINLIDGLDGLAAGVVFFSSLVLLGLSIFSGRFVVAMGFAALAGSTLGFLRYNFNPATIFMGDCGSYFLGYMLAGLSIMGSVKGQTTVALLIPIVAMGVPLFDTIVAPIRRFVRGRPMFQPDKGHLHHQLLRLGLNHRNTVLLLYGATIMFGLVALGTVFIKDLRAAVILAILAIGVFWIFRRMGYLEYLATDKIGGYFYDMGDLMGVTTHRRTFLDRQIEIEHAHNHDDLWQQAVSALELLKIDRAVMRINGRLWTMGVEVKSREGSAAGGWNENTGKGRFADAAVGDGVLAMHLPLVEVKGKRNYGTLYLEKDIHRDPLSPFTLRRIEQLRRSLVAALKRLEK